MSNLGIILFKQISNFGRPILYEINYVRSSVPEEHDLVGARFAMKIERILNEILDEQEIAFHSTRGSHEPYSFRYSTKNDNKEKSPKSRTRPESKLGNENNIQK